MPKKPKQSLMGRILESLRTKRQATQRQRDDRNFEARLDGIGSAFKNKYQLYQKEAIWEFASAVAQEEARQGWVKATPEQASRGYTDERAIEDRTKRIYRGIGEAGKKDDIEAIVSWRYNPVTYPQDIPNYAQKSQGYEFEFPKIAGEGVLDPGWTVRGDSKEILAAQRAFAARCAKDSR